MLTPISRPIVAAVLFYLAVNGLDILTSLFAPDSVYETNPFARDMYYRFDLVKGLEVKTWFFLSNAAISSVIFLALRKYNRAVAEAAASTLFVVHGGDVLLNAVIPNLLFLRGLYIG